MSKKQIITTFAAFIFWASALLLVLSNDGSENIQNDSIKSTIIIDTEEQIAYSGHTDNLKLLSDNKIPDFQDKLKESREIAAEKERLIKAKLEKEKRIAEEKRLAAEKAEAERIAEEARQVELARVAEEKRLADLEAQRVARNKEKEEAKKNGTEQVVVSRGSDDSFKESYYEITAYTAGFESTGKTPDDPNYGLTASGAYVTQGVTIACPPEIAFGTKINIEGYGIRVCQDRGSHIQTGRLDLYMESLDAALAFGRQTIKVKIYK